MEIFKIPTIGWKKDGSFSYGADMLYNSIPKVAVKIFDENNEELAKKTFIYLKELGIKSVCIKDITHVDKKHYYYVFAEQFEFVTAINNNLIEIQLEEK